jgi:hypothetical protein
MCRVDNRTWITITGSGTEFQRAQFSNRLSFPGPLVSLPITTNDLFGIALAAPEPITRQFLHDRVKSCIQKAQTMIVNDISTQLKLSSLPGSTQEYTSTQIQKGIDVSPETYVQYPTRVAKLPRALLNGMRTPYRHERAHRCIYRLDGWR